MNPRLNSQIDDIDAIKARNKIVASDPGLQPILLQSRQDLEKLIDKLVEADVLQPVVNENLVVTGYKAYPGVNLTHQFVVTVEGDTLLRTDIIARQNRGLAYSSYRLKDVTGGQPIPLQEYGNNIACQVYNEVLATMILSFKPQIKDYVHITLPKCPVMPPAVTPQFLSDVWQVVNLIANPHTGKHIIFIVGHQMSEINEKVVKPEALANSAAQSLLNLHIGTANLHLAELKEYEALHHANMPPQAHSDMVDTINGLEMERTQIINRLTQLKTWLLEEKQEIESEKEESNHQEMTLLRNYVKPARRHPESANQTTQYVKEKLKAAQRKKCKANGWVEFTVTTFWTGVAVPFIPVSFINKWAKRRTRSDYEAMHAYKEFMDSKLQLFTQYDERLAKIEHLTQAINRGFTAVEVTETSTITQTQQQEEHQIVVPSKRM